MFSKYKWVCSLAIFLCLMSNWITGGEGNEGGNMVKNLRVNPERLYERIMALSKIGETPDGGVNRVAYSEEDMQGRQFIISLMRKLGLSITIDEAANIIGTLKGRDPSRPPILFGSHIDTVPNSGKYDGALGVLGALECIEVLVENNVVPDHTLQVVVFTDEEGGLAGSRAMVGELDAPALKVVSQSGKTIREGIKALGGNPDNLVNAVKKKGDFKAFIELHIEQGSILVSKNVQIGIVQGIVGINRWDVFIEGAANHAGTTPMNMRRDALLAAAHLIIEINRLVRGTPGNQVATVGKISAHPGAVNVIPGSVLMSLEIRDLSSKKIQWIFNWIEKKASEIAQKTETQITFKAIDVTALPAPTYPGIRKVISEVAEELGLTSLSMPSGAGHDAQEMARITRIGMIFIPSVGGISHSPKEYSRKSDIVNGVNVLLHTILKIDSGALHR
ncbi:MAG: hydantoinase/carbamoylase family amidase [Candidatus Aminicenantes bacterium]|nr:hydantoinase/carbamoylase family amidase [Candidatus Aminicenantes bacterium]NIM78869.1 hydantoinase/carbamoylase family amidase [Candidatus Aminicenantes bacterium]NIN18125.1 hydantoinase/carbamoylase family amidase [Candidatus Aminicenantes bacterium]NIN42024.1 hydantoinase/carbamoylase family amidase [Candidatus Aminicenantes bacterium]NIN84780.1 hydantoinase/carbamoylase family amidase [Candidatus Aminicenantes bacterium]